MTQDCIFCKIVEGKIPSAKVYEDENVVSFLDISPNNKGHCLVVPKNHAASLIDIPDEDLEAVALAVKKVAKAVSKAFDCDFNIVMNNGKAANQVVFHAHLHVIPRFANDGLKFEGRHLKYDGDEMKHFAEKIRKHV